VWTQTTGSRTPSEPVATAGRVTSSRPSSTNHDQPHRPARTGKKTDSLNRRLARSEMRCVFLLKSRELVAPPKQSAPDKIPEDQRDHAIEPRTRVSCRPFPPSIRPVLRAFPYLNSTKSISRPPRTPKFKVDIPSRRIENGTGAQPAGPPSRTATRHHAPRLATSRVNRQEVR